MTTLAGRAIAITGASSGIGRATALACARAGMSVAAGARRMSLLESLVREIRDRGGRAIAIEVDVTDAAGCRRLIDATAAEFGAIYGVFANAGYGMERPIVECSEAQLRDIFEVNFWGTMNTLRPALERMLRAGEGHALVCSSCVSKMAVPGHGHYAATKAAQDHVARALRLELRGTGVLVSSVHPIGTRTEFRAVSEARSGDARAVRTPRVFMQSSDRVAAAVVRQLRRGRGGEVWTSTLARLTFAAGVAFPSLADAVLSRMGEAARAPVGGS